MERKDIITMKGNPLTLVGKEIHIGDPAPDVELLSNDLSPVKLSFYLGKICVIATVPSLDTSVCDLETRRFNQEAANLGSDVQILTISMDLPFSQSRWCGQTGVDKVITLSDHRQASLGMAFGVLIKELRLLARAIFVLDRDGIVRYIQIVNEIGEEPDYDAVLNTVNNLV